jgi:hypothetical protein
MVLTESFQYKGIEYGLYFVPPDRNRVFEQSRSLDISF